MDIRNTDGGIHSSAKVMNATPAFGVLLIAGATPYVTADIGSTNEVLDSTGGGSGGVTAGSAFGVTQTIATGLLTVQRSGYYEVELEVTEFSNGAAVGNVTFSVEKNSAAFSGEDVLATTRAAATGKAGLSLKGVRQLKTGDTIRAKVADSGAGGAVTITKGYLKIKQIADSITDKTA